jgi:hypothetical protein
MLKLRIGDHVEFELEEEERPVRGRILAITATECAVAVQAKGIYWVAKRSVVQL